MVSFLTIAEIFNGIPASTQGYTDDGTYLSGQLPWPFLVSELGGCFMVGANIVRTSGTTLGHEPKNVALKPASFITERLSTAREFPHSLRQSLQLYQTCSCSFLAKLLSVLIPPALGSVFEGPLCAR